jgi:hypothetical protein
MNEVVDFVEKGEEAMWRDGVELNSWKKKFGLLLNIINI